MTASVNSMKVGDKVYKVVHPYDSVCEYVIRRMNTYGFRVSETIVHVDTATHLTGTPGTTNTTTDVACYLSEFSVSKEEAVARYIDDIKNKISCLNDEIKYAEGLL